MSFFTEGPDINSNLVVVIAPMLLAWALIIVSSIKLIKNNPDGFRRESMWPLLISAILTLVLLALYSRFVSEYWNPGEQNWKFEYNGVMLSQGQSPPFPHSSPHGASLLMAPFFLIFGAAHLAAVVLNALAMMAAALFASLAAREASGGRKLPAILAGPLLVTYFPVIAIWAAGGEYAIFLACMSAAMWLILRSLKDSSTASITLCSAVIFMTALIRVEGFFLWLLWPFALFIAGKLNLKKLAAIAGGAAGSLTLILIAIYHIAFGNAGRPILRFEHLAQNSSWLAFFLSDGIIVLLLTLPGLPALAQRNAVSAFTLLCLSTGYAVFWLFGPNLDHFQISTQIFLPLCVIAASAFSMLYEKKKIVLIGVATLALVLQAMPFGTAYNHLSGKMRIGQQRDREVRTLAAELDGETPLIANHPHVRMTMPHIKPHGETYININEFASFSQTRKKIACFSSIEKPGECLFTYEMFPRGSVSLLEPEKFGYSLEKRIQNGETFLNIYAKKRAD